MKHIRSFAFTAVIVGAFFAMGSARAEQVAVASAPNMCMDWSTGYGVLAACSGSAAQDMDLPYDRMGRMRVGQNCISLSAGEGGQLIATRCARRTEQSWHQDASGAIVNGTGLCIDAEGARTSAGTRLIAYGCNGHSNQLWIASDSYPSVTPPPPPPSRRGTDGGQVSAILSPAHAPGMCLDVRGGGSDLIIFNCHSKKNQTFAFSPYGETEIQTGNTCLTAPSAAGQSVFVSRCVGSYAQRWMFQNDGTIRSASGGCMDVSRASTQAGTPVIIFGCSANANQRWSVMQR